MSTDDFQLEYGSAGESTDAQRREWMAALRVAMLERGLKVEERERVFIEDVWEARHYSVLQRRWVDELRRKYGEAVS